VLHLDIPQEYTYQLPFGKKNNTIPEWTNQIRICLTYIALHLIFQIIYILIGSI